MLNNAVIKPLLLFTAVAVLAVMISLLSRSFAQEVPLVVHLDEAKWTPPGGGNGFPVGVRTMTLGVDSESGGVTYYALFPAGSHFDLHWHTYSEYVAVLSGSVNLVLGPESHSLSAGSYIVIPGGVNHAWDVPEDSDVVILVRRSGPADFHFVSEN